MPTLSDQFRAAVEGYLTHSGIKASEFGRQAVGDPTFVLNLRRGRSCKLDTADRVLAYIGAQQGGAFVLRPDGSNPTVR